LKGNKWKHADATMIGKYTYQDNVPVEKMAQVCMENYDLAFDSIAQAGGTHQHVHSIPGAKIN